MTPESSKRPRSLNHPHEKRELLASPSLSRDHLRHLARRQRDFLPRLQVLQLGELTAVRLSLQPDGVNGVEFQRALELLVALRRSEAELSGQAGFAEFLHEPETPAKVMINEALDLARTFSGDEAVRFINGVLDAIRREQQRA